MEINKTTIEQAVIARLCDQIMDEWNWKEQARSGQIEQVVLDLLERHYDPGYAESTRRNFSRFADAVVLQAPDRSVQAMRALAQALVAADT